MAKTIGVVPPCITLFDDSGEIDYRKTCQHVDWLIDIGVDGLIIIGTCGEFPALDRSERTRLAEEIIGSTDSRIPIYVGVNHTSTRTAIELAKHAEQADATGIMSVSPYYSAPPEREVLTYFRDLAASVSIPLIVYNNPGASGVSLSIQALADLANEGVASIIKESHGDPTRIHDLRLKVPEQTSLIYGEDYGAYEAILAGADGWVAGVGNFMPRHALRLWELCRTGDVNAAKEHWFRILPLVNMTSHKPMFGRPDERPDYIQIYKASLDILGRYGGPTRRPLLPLPDDDSEFLKSLIQELSMDVDNA